MDELFDQEIHVRTGKIYYRNSTFKVYYHQRPVQIDAPHLQFGIGTAVVFQLDNSGKFTNPVVDDEVFRGVILMLVGVIWTLGLQIR